MDSATAESPEGQAGEVAAATNARDLGVHTRATRLEVRGRVFARATVDEVGGSSWGSDLEVASARITVRAERKGWFRGEVEAELSSGAARIRDAYLRFSPTRDLQLRVGRFRRPVGVVALTNQWNLPTIERGLLSDVEVDGVELPVGGREVGGMVRKRFAAAGAPTVSLGVFRGSPHTAAGRVDGAFTEDILGRLEVGGDVARVGVSGGVIAYLRASSDRGSARNGALGSVDVYGKVGGFSYWGEVFVGDNILALVPDGVLTVAEGRFYAARIIAAYTLKIGTGPLRRLQLYVGGQGLDPTTAVDRNLAFEGTAGVNVFVRKWLQGQFGYRYVVGETLSPVLERKAAMVQLSAVF